MGPDGSGSRIAGGSRGLTRRYMVFCGHLVQNSGSLNWRNAVTERLREKHAEDKETREYDSTAPHPGRLVAAYGLA